MPGPLYTQILRIINYRNQFSTAAVSKLTSNAVSTFSVNISGLVANYKDLTVDNFICDFESYTVTSSPGDIAYDSSGTASVNQTKNIIKSYDASTGDFTAAVSSTSVVARTNGCYLYMEYNQKQGQNAYGRVTLGASAKFNVYLVIY